MLPLSPKKLDDVLSWLHENVDGNIRGKYDDYDSSDAKWTILQYRSVNHKWIVKKTLSVNINMEVFYEIHMKEEYMILFSLWFNRDD